MVLKSNGTGCFNGWRACILRYAELPYVIFRWFGVCWQKRCINWSMHYSLDYSKAGFQQFSRMENRCEASVHRAAS